MRLHAIRLVNFRQFSGEQEFGLTSDSLKPVTLIFGANGAGKTTLLNAFTWALYGRMSDDVEEQDRLANDTVWRSTPLGEKVEVAVELTFDHVGHDYRLLRRVEIHKKGDRQQVSAPEVSLWTTRADGSSEKVEAPQEKIYSILPVNVSRFLFFNGERIEKLVQKGAYTEVRKDIKVLLGLEQVERAIAHLPKVDRRLSADLRKHGGEKAGKIQAAIDELLEQEASARETLKVLDDELAVLTEERENIAELLRRHASVAPIQKDRDAVAEELAEARSALKVAQEERAALVGSEGFLAFTDEVATAAAGMAAELYQRGALPSPLKREFVDQLIEEGRCICGTPLTENEKPWENVLEWRQRAGLQAVETAWQQLSGQIPSITESRSKLQKTLEGVIERIATARDQVSRREERMSELDGQLENTPLEDVRQLESKRIDLEKRITAKRERVGSVKSTLEQVQRDIAQKKVERSKAQVTDELAVKARARSDLVQSVQRALQEILAIRSENMRRRLDEELKAVFARITIKPFIPQLNHDFELTLHQEIDGVQLPVPKSTGENQILSLSFVAAVSKLAREIRKERSAEGELADDAGTYPIVMDAAFGSLDQNYQREVSEALAEMAPQLVVLVSKSQGLGQVLNRLLPHVSHVGVIVTHTTAEGNVSEDIELEGVAHPYIRAGAEVNRAELKVIR